MDELIESFIEDNYTEGLQEEILRSFSLFDFFEYNDIYGNFIDLLTDLSNRDIGTVQLNFTVELNKHLDYVLKQHTIEVTDETTIYEKNEIITALARLLKLDDYTSTISLLESFETDEEILSLILSDNCLLPDTKIMTLIDRFDPSMLKTLKEYIYSKEKDEDNNINIDILTNVKLFFKLFTNNSIGLNLVRSNILIGEPFETYLQYVEGDLITPDNNTTALNILSVIILSSDGYESSLVTYSNYALRLLQDLNKVGTIEAIVINLISKFEEFKKANHEKNRLSTSSNN